MQINCCVPNVMQPSAIRWRIIVEKQHECTNLGTDLIINTNIVSPFKRYKHEIVDTSGENGLSPRGAWFFPEKYSHSGWAQSRCYSTSKVKAGSFWVTGHVLLRGGTRYAGEIISIGWPRNGTTFARLSGSGCRREQGLGFSA